MINRIVRNTFKPAYGFCIQLKKDWQHNRQIQNHLNANSINEAFGTLVQSHLHGQVLDIQIYYTLYNKMEELNSDRTYFQLLYKLYRGHFQPHCLMKNWMKGLLVSDDQKLVEFVKNDYKELLKTSSQYMNDEQEQQTTKIHQKSNAQPSQNNISKKKQQKSIKTKNQTKEQQHKKESISFQYLTEQLKNFIKILTKENNNVSLYNVDINYSKTEQQTVQSSKIFETDGPSESINSQDIPVAFDRITIEKIQVMKQTNLQSAQNKQLKND